MRTLIFNDWWEFKQREDKSVNGVSPSFAEKNPDFKKDNLTNSGCWECSNCTECSDCIECLNCTYCGDCIREELLDGSPDGDDEYWWQ